jgi:cytoskeletal protein RodZ
MTAARNNISLNLPEGVPGGGGRPDLPAASEIDITKDKLGEIIGGRRHQLGLKIEEIAEDIKIRADYLRAIEQEDFDSLPTPQYTRLFLKSYAERLGLNVSEIYAIYDLHHRPPQEAVPKPRPGETVVPLVPLPRAPQAPRAPRADHTRIWLFIVVGIIVLLTVAAILTRVLKSSGNRAAAKENVQEQQAAPTQQQAGATQSSSPPPTTATPASAAPDTMASDSSSQPVIDAEMRMVLTFSQNTWVCLVADADTVINKVLTAGQSVEGKASNQFVLSLGHTVGVEASVNGHPLRPFSTWTKGFGGMVITADSVGAWMIPGAATTGGGAQ